MAANTAVENRPGREKRSFHTDCWHHIVVALCTLYIVTATAFDTFRIEYLFLFPIVVVLAYTSDRTRVLLRLLLPLLIFCVIYNSMRFLPEMPADRIKVAEPYHLEKTLFGISAESGVLTPNEYWQVNHVVFLDWFCGAVYAAFLVVPLSFVLYLFVKHEYEQLSRFAWAFLVLNVLGFITYFVYPAFPPWYVEKYGLGIARVDVSGDPAALARIDCYLGINLFGFLYSKEVIVFSAIPSLHVACPLLTLFFAHGRHHRFFLFLLFYCLSINFAAVYLNHHYIIDIILGNLYAVIVFVMFHFMARTE